MQYFFTPKHGSFLNQTASWKLLPLENKNLNICGARSLYYQTSGIQMLHLPANSVFYLLSVYARYSLQPGSDSYPTPGSTCLQI